MAETIRSPRLGRALSSFMQRRSSSRRGALRSLSNSLTTPASAHFPFALALLSTQSCAAVRSSSAARASPPRAVQRVGERVGARGGEDDTISGEGVEAREEGGDDGGGLPAPVGEEGGGADPQHAEAVEAREEVRRLREAQGLAQRRQREGVDVERRLAEAVGGGGGAEHRARVEHPEDVREQVVRQHLVEERRAAPPRPLAAREGEAPCRRAQRRAAPPQRAPRRRRARARARGLGGGGGGGGLEQWDGLDRLLPRRAGRRRASPRASPSATAATRVDRRVGARSAAATRGGRSRRRAAAAAACAARP